jgi:hypothetical protein
VVALAPNTRITVCKTRLATGLTGMARARIAPFLPGAAETEPGEDR